MVSVRARHVNKNSVNETYLDTGGFLPVPPDDPAHAETTVECVEEQRRSDPHPSLLAKKRCLRFSDFAEIGFASDRSVFGRVCH